MQETNGNKILIDTNIIIYVLLWNEDYTKKLIDKEIFYSVVSKLEVLWFSFDNDEDEKKALEFFTQANQLNIDKNIEDLVINFKKRYKIKLPDCIILATAIFNNIKLLTNDLNLLKIYNRVLSDVEILQQAKITGL